MTAAVTPLQHLPVLQEHEEESSYDLTVRRQPSNQKSPSPLLSCTLEKPIVRNSLMFYRRVMAIAALARKHPQTAGSQIDALIRDARG